MLSGSWRDKLGNCVVSVGICGPELLDVALSTASACVGELTVSWCVCCCFNDTGREGRSDTTAEWVRNGCLMEVLVLAIHLGFF